MWTLHFHLWCLRGCQFISGMGAYISISAMFLISMLESRVQLILYLVDRRSLQVSPAPGSLDSLVWCWVTFLFWHKHHTWSYHLIKIIIKIKITLIRIVILSSVSGYKNELFLCLIQSSVISLELLDDRYKREDNGDAAQEF